MIAPFAAKSRGLSGSDCLGPLSRYTLLRRAIALRLSCIARTPVTLYIYMYPLNS